MWLVALFCIFICLFSLALSNDNVLAPSVLTPIIWLGTICLYAILPHSLPPIQSQFLLAISLWVGTVCLGSLSAQSLSYQNLACDANLSIRNLYLIITVVTFPLIILWAKNAIETGTEGIATSLRTAATGRTQENGESYGGLYILVWQVSYLLELAYYKRENLWRVLLSGAIYLSFALITFSRASLLVFAMQTITYLFFTKKIPFRTLFIGLFSVLAVAFIMQAFRNGTNVESQEGRYRVLVLYLVGNMCSFDTLQPCSSPHWGENVFRIYYAIRYKLGLSDIQPVHTILPWIHKPLVTNTYTTLYPFYKDFGYWGVGIFGFLYGCMYGCFFKKAQSLRKLAVLLYVYIIGVIVMQFAGETFLTNLSAHVKFFIILYLPFFVEKYGLLTKHTTPL